MQDDDIVTEAICYCSGFEEGGVHEHMMMSELGHF